MRFEGILRLTLSGLLALVWGVGCSGSKQDEEELLPAEQGGEEATEAESDEAEAAVEDDGADEVTADDTDLDTSSFAMSPEPAPAAPAASEAAPNAKRVVRYVKRDGVEIFSSPQGGTPVGKLRKGDRVLVIEEGKWGRVTDGMFIKLGDLSNKAVARERGKAQWQKPAH